VQVVVIPISERHVTYAEQVVRQLKDADIRVELVARNEKMNGKIREHALQKVPFMLVVGDKESEKGEVNVRTRGHEKTETIAATEFLTRIKRLIAEKKPTLD
jgi:threonyl-tRNA synthetase